MAGKREDETLLEYLLRLVKEGGEGYGELANERLRRSRPDVARKRGLMPDQLDIVQDDYMTPGVQDSLLPPQVTDTAGADRATIEQMITQAGQPRPFEEPQPLQEWTGRGAAPEPDPALMQRMLTQPSATDSAITNWAGVGQAPGEDPSLMQQDLEQTRAKEQAELYDQVTPGPITPRVPTTDIAATSPVNFPGTQVGPMSNLERARMRDVPVKEEDVTKTNLLERAQTFLQENIPEERLKGATGIEEFLKRAVGQTGKGFGHVQPGRLATYGFGGPLGEWLYKLAGKPDIADLVTVGHDLAPVIADAKEMITGEKVEEDTGWIKGLLVGEVVETPDVGKGTVSKKPTVKQSVAQAKEFTGSAKKITAKSEKPTYFGHGSKEDFLRAAGILGGDKRSLDFTGRMDKIDSDGRMFDIIAMLGGAGDSNVGRNFRNKSYQRLKLEFDMDQNEWDRNFKIMAHPWDTWYWFDPEAGIKPVSRPRGMGMGEGWQQQPTTRDKGTPYGRNFDSLLEMWDGTPKSEALMRIRYINEQIPSGMFLETDGQDTAFNNFMDVAFPLPKGGKRWTPLEIQQARLAISKGSKGDLMKIMKIKNYVPPELIPEIKLLFPELFPE